jgi:hypothetical protein
MVILIQTAEPSSSESGSLTRSQSLLLDLPHCLRLRDLATKAVDIPGLSNESYVPLILVSWMKE